MAHGIRLWPPTSLLLIVLAACGTGLIPGDAAMPPGSRQWIISVDNQSAEDARMSVALDTMPVGDEVGTVDPPTVPADTTLDVVFTVPPGRDWAIFVNPSPERGPILIASDVPPDVAGRLPIFFAIDARGEVTMAAPADLGPGWMGE